MKTWQSKLKSPYTPEVGGAQARIDSRVKLLQRPSGCQDHVQLTDSLSILAAVGLKVVTPEQSSWPTYRSRFDDVGNIINDNGNSLNDSSDDVLIFLLGKTSNGGQIVII
jgi:hypothetical protein